MHVHDYERQLMLYDAYRLHKNLLFYVPPVLLVLGTIGNVISVIILTRKPMRKYSTYFYLAVLSSADTFVLYVGLLRMWLGEVTGHDVRDQNTWACKLISVSGYAVSDFSGWLIVAVTAERYVAVCHPFKATNVCSRPRAAKVVAFLFCLLLGINLHFLWTVAVTYIDFGGREISHCSGGQRYRRLIDEIWPWIDAFIYSFIPFLAILVLNLCITRQVIKARRQRRQMGCGVELGSGKTPRGADASKITPMLLAISVTFLVTTLPVNITSITTAFLSKNADIAIESLVGYRLARTVTELLMYLNHSMNFFLYCATGHKFRQQLLRSFPARRRGRRNRQHRCSDCTPSLLSHNVNCPQKRTRGRGQCHSGPVKLTPNVLLWPQTSNSLTVTLQVQVTKLHHNQGQENVPLRDCYTS